MQKLLLPLATIVMISQCSSAIAADPHFRQAQPLPGLPQRGGTIPQLQLIPDYLSQQITTLQQQVANLQGQVNVLRSIMQITQNDTTIQGENLNLNAAKTLRLSSGKQTELPVGNDLRLTSGKNLLIKSGHTTTMESAERVNPKSPQIKMNDGNKSLAVAGSTVSGGKVITGSVPSSLSNGHRESFGAKLPELGKG